LGPAARLAAGSRTVGPPVAPISHPRRGGVDGRGREPVDRGQASKAFNVGGAQRGMEALHSPYSLQPAYPKTGYPAPDLHPFPA